MYNTYQRNTNKQFWDIEHTECNCGSFALDVTSWFAPYDNKEDEEYTFEERLAIMMEMYSEGYSKQDIMESILERDVINILSTCPWVERINLEEAEDTDRVIAYRLFIDEESLEDGCIDEDFHFRVRVNGVWYEKCGTDNIRVCGCRAQKTPWQTGIHLIYDSDIAYFRFKKAA